MSVLGEARGHGQATGEHIMGTTIAARIAPAQLNAYERGQAGQVDRDGVGPDNRSVLRRVGDATAGAALFGMLAAGFVGTVSFGVALLSRHGSPVLLPTLIGGAAGAIYGAASFAMHKPEHGGGLQAPGPSGGTDVGVDRGGEDPNSF